MRILKMKNRFAAFFILFFAAMGVCQTAPQPAPQAAKTRQVMMWKVKSATTTVYLLGSMHLGDKDLYPLPEVVESAFKASPVLVEEINLKKLDASAAMKLIQQYGFYAEGDTLSMHLSKNTSNALDGFCNKYGFPRAAMEKFKPWVAALTVETFTLQKAGEDATLGIDLHFVNEIKDPQRIEELETADYQMNLLSSATETEQQEMLAETLKEMDKPAEHLQEIKDALFSGDPEVMAKFMDAHSTPKSLYKKLVDDRNGPMAEKIDGYLKGKDQCFVVVGAGHLVGDKGVVKLLEQKEYKVEMIKAEAK